MGELSDLLASLTWSKGEREGRLYAVSYIVGQFKKDSERLSENPYGQNWS